MSKVWIGIGIIFAIIILFFTASFIANLQFVHKANKEVVEFFNTNVKPKDEVKIINQTDLEALPASVQKWLEYSQVIGKEEIISARSKQTVVMKLSQKQHWMPVEAEQYFTIDEPGFIWRAKVKAAPAIHIAARDKYHRGEGNMLIKINSLITIADSHGKEMDQGTLLRYLAEIVWVPTAALRDYIQWEEIDANSALATMSYQGVTASGVFTFNDQGEVLNFTAERYGEFNGEFRLETWLVLMEDYREFEGIRVPTKGEVVWKLKDGDFSWYHFQVKDLEYNNPLAY